MREKMIKKIESATGVSGPTWASWTDQEVNKLYVFLLLGAVSYIEDADMIGR